MFFKQGLVLFVVTFFIHQIHGKLPSSITTCPRTHPDPNTCIIEAVNKVRPLLAQGDLGDGFLTPPLEPLKLENIEMSRGTEFVAVFSEIEARGGSNFTIEKLKSNISELIFDITVFLPKIDFKGKYTLNIRLLLLNIKGNGDVSGTLYNSRGFVKMHGKKINKDGINYVKFDRLPLKIKVGDAKLRLDNLFGGDPILGQIGNSIVNDNSRLFLEEILPGLERSLSKIFLDIANKILQTATFDEMFPEN